MTESPSTGYLNDFTIAALIYQIAISSQHALKLALMPLFCNYSVALSNRLQLLEFMFSHRGTEAQRIYFLESLGILGAFVKNKF
ncbi:MAG: hypothetical protein LBJ67_14790 [Planctomycetaceae bacterium]|jgi:hypothetical protein|nr:hypothetical protein [Planctomycetaceae bacterium]